MVDLFFNFFLICLQLCLFLSTSLGITYSIIVSLKVKVYKTIRYAHESACMRICGRNDSCSGMIHASGWWLTWDSEDGEDGEDGDWFIYLSDFQMNSTYWGGLIYPPVTSWGQPLATCLAFQTFSLVVSMYALQAQGRGFNSHYS